MIAGSHLSTRCVAALAMLLGSLAPLFTPAASAQEATVAPRPAGTRGFGMSRTIYGEILSDDRGFTLYTWDGDDLSISRCYDDCAALFPPFIVNTRRPQGSGFTAAFGIIERADGSLQGTANGAPLYYFSGDTAPGHTNGHGAPGGWWILNDKPRVLDPEE
jgi:predicted lipoprotein with Yx(FWY)xxD motif